MAKKAKQGSKKEGAVIPAVAIGGSAGSLQALQILFEELPEDTGLAYVVITHLNPDQPSDLAPILARHTKMAVEEVTDRTTLKANVVFVIPPNRKLLASGDELRVVAFNEPRGLRAPIDHFFRSFGERHGDGFAIVLSGTGSDGAVGLKAIKEGGGVILVQDPIDATFGSMPRSAIATGLADAVLPAKKMAARLVELAQDKRALEAAGETHTENAISTRLFARPHGTRF